MILPLKHLKSTRGQMLILFLVIMVIGLAIVISVASRAVTDIRITTTSDESNRAYFAAEAGIEEALGKLAVDPSFSSPTPFDVDFTTLAQAKAGTTVKSDCPLPPPGQCRNFVYPEAVKKDDEIQVALIDNFGTGDWPLPPWGLIPTVINFYWGSDVDVSISAAMEVTIIYYHPGTKQFLTRRFPFDPLVVRRGLNNFCSRGAVDPSLITGGETITDDLTDRSTTFYFKAIINTRHGINCGAHPLPGAVAAWRPVMARIRLLYNTDPEPIAVTVDAPEILPAQGALIESTGETLSGVTRKLRTIRLHPGLSALYGYVLFSGSTTKDIKK